MSLIITSRCLRLEIVPSSLGSIPLLKRFRRSPSFPATCASFQILLAFPLIGATAVANSGFDQHCISTFWAMSPTDRRQAWETAWYTCMHNLVVQGNRSLWINAPPFHSQAAGSFETHFIRLFRWPRRIRHQSPVAMENSIIHACICFSSFPVSFIHSSLLASRIAFQVSGLLIYCIWEYCSDSLIK